MSLESQLDVHQGIKRFSQETEMSLTAISSLERFS